MACDTHLLVILLQQLAVPRQHIRLCAEVVIFWVRARLLRDILPQVILTTEGIRPGEVVDDLVGVQLLQLRQQLENSTLDKMQTLQVQRAGGASQGKA